MTDRGAVLTPVRITCVALDWTPSTKVWGASGACSRSAPVVSTEDFEIEPGPACETVGILGFGVERVAGRADSRAVCRRRVRAGSVPAWPWVGFGDGR